MNYRCSLSMNENNSVVLNGRSHFASVTVLCLRYVMPGNVGKGGEVGRPMKAVIGAALSRNSDSALLIALCIKCDSCGQSSFLCCISYRRSRATSINPFLSRFIDPRGVGPSSVEDSKMVMCTYAFCEWSNCLIFEMSRVIGHKSVENAKGGGPVYEGFYHCLNISRCRWAKPLISA